MIQEGTVRTDLIVLDEFLDSPKALKYHNTFADI